MYQPVLIKEWMKHPTKIMLLLCLFKQEGITASEIRKETKITDHSTYKYLKEFEDKKLIYFVKIKDKRRFHIWNKIYYLTNSGKIIADKLNEIDLLLSSI